MTRTVTNARALTQKLNHRLANLEAEKENAEQVAPKHSACASGRSILVLTRPQKD